MPMTKLNDFHPHSFDIAGTENDLEYYTHHKPAPLIDQGGYKTIEALYHTLIQKGDTILDLMCGSNSHIPANVPYQDLIGIDIDNNALQQNHQLTKKILQDINQNLSLPLQDNSVDYICLCSVIEYLRNPFAILEECYRILKPQGRIIFSFSPRYLATRTIALWQALDNGERQRLIKILLKRSGFNNFDQGEVHPPDNQPLWKSSIYSVVASKI